MASTIEREAPVRAADRQPDSSASSLARDFRWRVVGDPPPSPEPTRFQRIYTWLYEFNRY